MRYLTQVQKFLSYFNLEAEKEDHDAIHFEIIKGITFKGTNLWILIFAIIIASVGLNMNSTAVIIGAMLISPLMGPINGIGYSIAIYDFDLLRKSVRHFAFAVATSVITSFFYFLLSPVSTAQSELLARINPTIYDVLIALFGGFAGIVALCTRQKGNVIPGVAIATALMPPLCTAGYGLATAKADFFFGAMYLFTINSIFIALAAVWVSQLLKLPIRSLIDEPQKKRINNLITGIITIVILPSIYFGYQLVQKEKFTQRANLYVANIGLFEGNLLIKNTIEPSSRTIHLMYGGNTLTNDQKNAIIKKSEDFGLEKATIDVEQGFQIEKPDQMTMEAFKLKGELSILNVTLQSKQSQIDSLQRKNLFGRELYTELKALFPMIANCVYSESYVYPETKTGQSPSPFVILYMTEEISNEEKTKITEWLKIRVKNQKAVVNFMY